MSSDNPSPVGEFPLQQLQQLEIIDGRPFRINEVVSAMVIDGGVVLLQDAHEAHNSTDLLRIESRGAEIESLVPGGFYSQTRGATTHAFYNGLAMPAGDELEMEGEVIS